MTESKVSTMLTVVVTYCDNVLGSRVLQLPGDLLRFVGRVDGGDGEAGPNTTQEGDGKLRDVGEKEGHHVRLISAQPAESRAKLDRAVPEHLVGVLSASHPATQGRQVSVLINIGEHKVGHVLLGNFNIGVGRPETELFNWGNSRQTANRSNNVLHLIMNSSSPSSMTPNGAALFFW